MAAGFAVLASVSCFGQAAGASLPSQGYHPEKDARIASHNDQPPDPHRLIEMRRKRVQQQQFSAANMERKRQMADDSARLLRFAMELNEELATEEAAGVTPAAVTRAGMIEQLARAVKDKMKLTVGQ